MAEKSDSIFKFLMSSGLLGFAGGLIALTVETCEQRKLDELAFQNDLLQSVIEIEDHTQRKSRFDLYTDMGLWKEEYYISDSILYKLGRSKGLDDSKHMNALKNAILKFKERNQGELPRNFNELLSQFRVKASLDYFNGNVQYNILGANSFEIISEGADGVLFYGQDKIERVP